MRKNSFPWLLFALPIAVAFFLLTPGVVSTRSIFPNHNDDGWLKIKWETMALQLSLEPKLQEEMHQSTIMWAEIRDGEVVQSLTKGYEKDGGLSFIDYWRGNYRHLIGADGSVRRSGTFGHGPVQEKERIAAQVEQGWATKSSERYLGRDASRILFPQFDHRPSPYDLYYPNLLGIREEYVIDNKTGVWLESATFLIDIYGAEVMVNATRATELTRMKDSKVIQSVKKDIENTLSVKP